MALFVLRLLPLHLVRLLDHLVTSLLPIPPSVPKHHVLQITEEDIM